MELIFDRAATSGVFVYVFGHVPDMQTLRAVYRRAMGYDRKNNQSDVHDTSGREQTASVATSAKVGGAEPNQDGTFDSADADDTPELVFPIDCITLRMIVREYAQMADPMAKEQRAALAKFIQRESESKSGIATQLPHEATRTEAALGSTQAAKVYRLLLEQANGQHVGAVHVQSLVNRALKTLVEGGELSSSHQSTTTLTTATTTTTPPSEGLSFVAARQVVAALQRDHDPDGVITDADLKLVFLEDDPSIRSAIRSARQGGSSTSSGTTLLSAHSPSPSPSQGPDRF